MTSMPSQNPSKKLGVVVQICNSSISTMRWAMEAKMLKGWLAWGTRYSRNKGDVTSTKCKVKAVSSRLFL